MRMAGRLAMIATALLAAGAAQAQECQRLPPAPGATGFQQRSGSDRCEGLYVSPVSGGGLQLLSLTFGRIAFDLDRDSVLHVHAPPDAAAGLRLLGSGVPLGLYYRLEAALDPSRPFQLPLTAVIRPSRIAASDLGLVGQRDAGGGRRIYVPLRAGTDPAPAAPTRDVVAILRPDSDVLDVRWRVTPAGTPPAAYRDVAGAGGPVPAGQRLEIAIPAWPAQAEAVLELRYFDIGGRERNARFQLAGR